MISELFIAANSLIALVLGVMVLIFPKLLRIILGLYLIVVGLLGIIA